MVESIFTSFRIPPEAIFDLYRTICLQENRKHAVTPTMGICMDLLSYLWQNLKGQFESEVLEIQKSSHIGTCRFLWSLSSWDVCGFPYGSRLLAGKEILRRLAFENQGPQVRNPKLV